jgi:hypothetical protein
MQDINDKQMFCMCLKTCQDEAKVYGKVVYLWSYKGYLRMSYEYPDQKWDAKCYPGGRTELRRNLDNIIQ